MLVGLLKNAFRRAPPPSVQDLFEAALTAYDSGKQQEAIRLCERALRTDPDFTPCNSLLAQIALPGPTYTEVLAFVHEVLRPRTYMEIGVFRGKALTLARPGTRVVGVDPQPQIPGALPPHVTVHAMTSDDYFARRDVLEDLSGPIDLAFIDGLHHFEQALRDFINVEKHCRPDSTVLVHDWYPLNRRTAERDMKHKVAFYSGDVWRLALVLKKYRPELKLSTIATAPTGLGVVRGLDPASVVLAERYDEIVAEFKNVDYGVLDKDKAATLNLVANDWNTIRALLA